MENNEAYIRNKDHLFYKLENGKVTSVNTEKKWIKLTAVVPTIYVEDLTISSKSEFEAAYQFALK